LLSGLIVLDEIWGRGDGLLQIRSGLAVYYSTVTANASHRLLGDTDIQIPVLLLFHGLVRYNWASVDLQSGSVLPTQDNLLYGGDNRGSNRGD
jgi:hypothetical protein